MKTRFEDKAKARSAVWDELQEQGVACFPFPPHHRIPNFSGAKAAAEALFKEEPWASAQTMKINPDAPQRFVRELALRRGVTLFIPTPRLRGGFFRVDPSKIPVDKIREAASLSKGARWSEAIPLSELPRIDAIVTGSVAVTKEGKRCGKGEGYADLEYAILRELGLPPTPVATTVHDLQVVQNFPTEDSDLPVALIVTPNQIIRTGAREKEEARIHWEKLNEKRLEEMPVLKDLRMALDSSNNP